MGNIGLALTLLLSLAAGVAVLSPLLWNGAATRWQTLVGYGFAAGLVLTTLIMRAGFAARLGLSFGVTAAGLVLATAIGAAATLLLRRPMRRTPRMAPPSLLFSWDGRTAAAAACCPVPRCWRHRSFRPPPAGGIWSPMPWSSRRRSIG